MPFEQSSRLVCDIPESTKVWFADFCRRNHHTMSSMLRLMVENLEKEHSKQTTQEKPDGQ